MNLDFGKVCGKHTAIYEAYYKQIDPKSSGAIEAMTAAKFLKKSGLSDVVLSRVWDLSDPNGKGFLDKPGFFVALKLVSLAQAGQVINMSNIYNDTPNPPKVGDLPKIMPPRMQTVPVTTGVVSGDWSISVIDRLKYEQLFETLKPIGNMLPGNKVKGVLMDSKLPMDTLGKIWDLADQDKDGNLDKHEFIVAMHLVYQTLEKRTVPDVLPPELRKPSAAAPPPKPAPPNVAPAVNTNMPRAPSGEGFGDGGFVANFPKDIAPPPAIPPLPLVGIPPMTRVPPVGSAAVPAATLISTDTLISIGAPPSVTTNADWVVTPSELKRYEVMFRDSDRDKDGLVSGLEVKNIFLQSGVPQQCLAHIWALCDTNQSGKLALEQFALAMWMVERKQKGIEPPQVLNTNMVPPSMRAIVAGIDMQPQAEPKPTYSNPELEMISKEIEELAKERRSLETEIAQKEADIRIKTGEVRSLQSELDTLSATLKQLENQRGEAQKRLDDLKAQVNKIREQCQKQEETINEQEGELNTKRSELQKLKDEETALQKEYDENNNELQKLTKHLQNTQLQISSVRSMVTQLMETQRQMTDALLLCRAAIENQDAELVSEYQLKIEPDFNDARKILEKKIDEQKTDPFDGSIAKTTTSNGFASNGFGNDPFTAGNTTTRTGFDDSFNTSSGFDSGFDAFGNSNAFAQHKDPFGGDAFGASKTNAVTPEPGKDDFGSDPFAALHAPTGQGQVLSPNAPQKSGPPPRPESPSPALPPKKSKVPPPRPAPPRPLQGPARPTQPATDAFGGATTSGSGFADFADFDNKLSIIPTPTTTQYATLPTIRAPPPPPIKTQNTLSTLTSLPATKTQDMLSSSSLFDLATLSDLPFTPLSSTTFASTSTTTTATTITATQNANSNLTRSNTSLQQAASVFHTTKTAAASAADKKTRAVSGPTDFSDDPFKDYRYEDPFSIKDPFADDDDIEDPEKVFKDDLSSDDEHKMKETKKMTFNSSKTSNSKTSQAFDSAKSQASISNEFLDNFAAFDLNSSPVPSQQSSVSGTNLALTSSTDRRASSASNKSHSNTPIPNAALFDDFANFDEFSLKSSSSNAGSLNLPVTASRKNNNNINNNNSSSTTITNKTNDSFFEAFNDHFEINSNVSNTKSNTNIFAAFGDANANSSDDAFGSASNLNTNTTLDAFTVATTHNANATVTKSANTFDDFNDNFEDDFFKPKPVAIAKGNNINLNQNNTSTLPANTSSAKFAAFDDDDADDFAADFTTALNNSKNLSSNNAAVTLPKLTKVQNHTMLSKTLNNKVSKTHPNVESGAKLAEKFASDYSKPETFDADLEEALKRSMADK